MVIHQFGGRGRRPAEVHPDGAAEAGTADGDHGAGRAGQRMEPVQDRGSWRPGALDDGQGDAGVPFPGRVPDGDRAVRRPGGHRDGDLARAVHPHVHGPDPAEADFHRFGEMGSGQDQPGAGRDRRRRRRIQDGQRVGHDGENRAGPDRRTGRGQHGDGQGGGGKVAGNDGFKGGLAHRPHGPGGCVPEQHLAVPGEALARQGHRRAFHAEGRPEGFQDHRGGPGRRIGRRWRTGRRRLAGRGWSRCRSGAAAGQVQAQYRQGRRAKDGKESHGHGRSADTGSALP